MCHSPSGSPLFLFPASEKSLPQDCCPVGLTLFAHSHSCLMAGLSHASAETHPVDWDCFFTLSTTHFLPSIGGDRHLPQDPTPHWVSTEKFIAKQFLKVTAENTE